MDSRKIKYCNLGDINVDNVTNRRILPEVLDDINAERIEQHKKWGIQNHTDFKWLAIITEELGEASQEALEKDFWSNKSPNEDVNNVIEARKKLLRKELIQVAASTIAFIEAIDRRS